MLFIALIALIVALKNIIRLEHKAAKIRLAKRFEKGKNIGVRKISNPNKAGSYLLSCYPEKGQLSKRSRKFFA